MVTALPLEILINVFFWLNQEDKVNCMTVCRHWEQTIKSTCLFHTIVVRTTNAFEKVIQEFKQNPSQGLQTECFVFDLNDSGLNTHAIYALCPNLKVLYRSTTGALYVKQHMDSTEPNSWDDHIEYIYAAKMESLSQQLLASKPAIHLKTLRVTDMNSFNSRVDRLLPLSNAPNLTTLSIEFFKLSIETLELIHITLLSLHSIEFAFCKLGNIALPENIRPAPSIRSVISSFDNFNVYGITVLAQYIYEKYLPYLEELSFSEVAEHFIIDGNVAGPTLNEGIVPLLSGLGPQLKRLTIRFDWLEMKHLKALLTTQCHIEHLDLGSYFIDEIVDGLTDIPQLHQLKSLHLREIESCNFGTIKELKYLKELTLLNFRSHVCDLTDIKKIRNNTVESITLKYIHIRPTLYSQLCSVKNLTLWYVRFHLDADVFIQSLFPKLKTLKLQHCTFPKKDLSFPDLHLSYFEFIRHDPKYDHHILVKTQQDKQGRWYFLKYTSKRWNNLKKAFSSQDSRVFQSTRSLAYEALDEDVPSYSFTFASVNNVTIPDYFY